MLSGPPIYVLGPLHLGQRNALSYVREGQLWVESCHDRNGHQSLHPARLDDDSHCRIPIIDAGTASLSPFQQTTKIVHDHAGIGVHVRLESAFTMRWKQRSRWAGICTVGLPETVQFVRPKCCVRRGFDSSDIAIDHLAYRADI